MRSIDESLNWEAKSELRLEVLHGIKEIGIVLYLISLLDIVLVSILPICSNDFSLFSF